MPSTKQKTLGYRRAEWIYDKPNMPTLERCIRDAFLVLKTVDDRTISGGGKATKCLAFDPNAAPAGVLLHLSVDTPGEAASIVPKGNSLSDKAEVDIVFAPEQSEFMDGDAFLYVKSNHMCLCVNTVHDASIRSFFYDIFRKAKLRQDSTQFDLLKLADIDKIEMIHAEKVKEVEIKASLYKASAAFSRRQHEAAGILSKTARFIRAFNNAPSDVTNDSLRVALTIKVDKRSRENLVLGEKRIEDIAVDLVENQEEGDDFTIITGSGRTIRPKELYVKSEAVITSFGQSVDRDDAWKKLRGFYLSLENSGILEKS